MTTAHSVHLLFTVLFALVKCNLKMKQELVSGIFFISLISTIICLFASDRGDMFHVNILRATQLSHTIIYSRYSEKERKKKSSFLSDKDTEKRKEKTN